MNFKKLIAVARGNASADLILSNARIVNTLNGDIEEGNVATCGGVIAGVGDYDRAKETIDLKGKYLSPGLIDGHVHVESSMLHIARYAEAVVPRGVSGVVTDLHEIANVKGLAGVKYMLKSARPLPLDVYFMAASCVPATHMETAGAELTSGDVAEALSWDETIGLGEMMNFPGVLFADDGVLAKIDASQGKVIDGHAPGLSGKDLNAYIACGIDSDHESTAFAEGREKLCKGMYLMIREGSSEKNLEELLPLVTDKTYKRCLFVVDDRSCSDLLRDGDIDAVVRKAIRLGLDPVRAIQMATINTAERFGLRGVGAIAPGYVADIVVIDDPSTFKAEMVFYKGKMVARDGVPLFTPSVVDNKAMTHTMKVKPFGIDKLRVPADKWSHPVIEIVPDQIITKRIDEKAKMSSGFAVADDERDILKLVVVERHRATGNIGLGFVKGVGLKRGALASSIAHDSHNIVAVGTNDDDLYAAIKQIEALGGGLVAVAGGKVIEALPLPVAGLLSDQPLDTVVRKMEQLEKAAAGLGSKLPAPFATLSFLALPVIPELRLSDKGLVDVLQFKILE
ncbi:MAG: adenine deaminase [Chloroflexota bacterium]|nr:adenine deaminase [Chloroflexota bacterium]